MFIAHGMHATSTLCNTNGRMLWLLCICDSRYVSRSRLRTSLRTWHWLRKESMCRNSFYIYNRPIHTHTQDCSFCSLRNHYNFLVCSRKQCLFFFQQIISSSPDRYFIRPPLLFPFLSPLLCALIPILMVFSADSALSESDPRPFCAEQVSCPLNLQSISLWWWLLSAQLSWIFCQCYSPAV